jgi:hypothetical protein
VALNRQGDIRPVICDDHIVDAVQLAFDPGQ